MTNNYSLDDNRLTNYELSEFKKNGFIIKNILTDDEVEYYKSAIIGALAGYGLQDTQNANPG